MIIWVLAALGFLVGGAVTMSRRYEPGEQLDAPGYWILAVMWVPCLALVLASFIRLCTSVNSSLRSSRDAPRGYERHPVLGDYCYEPNLDAWQQGRSTAGRLTFLLRGRGRRPTDDQLGIWKQVEAELPELLKAAIAAIPEPPVVSFRTKFSKNDLVLDEVRIERDRDIYFFFHTPIGEDLELSPMVVFAEGVVTAAQWVH